MVMKILPIIVSYLMGSVSSVIYCGSALGLLCSIRLNHVSQSLRPFPKSWLSSRQNGAHSKNVFISQNKIGKQELELTLLWVDELILESLYWF